MRLTGLHFSCCGMSSGLGTVGDLGLVSENSRGLVVLIGAFLTWLPWDILTASCSKRMSISGRHLKDKQTKAFTSCLWTNNNCLKDIFLTSVEGQSTVSPHRQHHIYYSIPLVSMWWGLWRRKSGTTAKHNTLLRTGHRHRWLLVISNATTVIKHWVSYHVHLLYVQWFNDGVEMLKPNVIKSKCGEVTDD